MKGILPRLLLVLPLSLGIMVAACDDDDDDAFELPAAPRVPTATPTPPLATPVPMPDVTATNTPVPSSDQPRTGEQVGFLGRIQEINGERMRIGRYDVVTSAGTEFARNGQPAELAEFSVGEDVRVAGEVLGDGSILATKLSLLPPS